MYDDSLFPRAGLMYSWMMLLTTELRGRGLKV